MKSFSSAMKAYFKAGKTPAQAMRQTWKDVHAGKVERPPRKKGRSGRPALARRSRVRAHQKNPIKLKLAIKRRKKNPIKKRPTQLLRKWVVVDRNILVPHLKKARRYEYERLIVTTIPKLLDTYTAARVEAAVMRRFLTKGEATEFKKRRRKKNPITARKKYGVVTLYYIHGTFKNKPKREGYFTGSMKLSNTVSKAASYKSREFAGEIEGELRRNFKAWDWKVVPMTVSHA